MSNIEPLKPTPEFHERPTTHLANKINEVIEIVSLMEQRNEHIQDLIQSILDELGKSKVPTLSVTSEINNKKDRH